MAAAPAAIREQHMHENDTQAYLIAVDRRRVGVAVTAGQGFRFIAADPAFKPLDGSSFRHLVQLEQAAERLARAVGKAPGWAMHR
jgi:hypothetical protein